MTKPTKPKGPMAPPKKRPVWTEVRLQAPMLAAAQHTCSTIVARPPAASGDLTPKHVAVIVGAAKAGVALIAKEYETIVRIESSGAEWRLRVALPSRVENQCDAQEWEALVASLIESGWLRVIGGGSPTRRAQYELLDPRS